VLNSDGMGIKLTKGGSSASALEYDVIGGVLNFYFFAGSETDPTEVARQYTEVSGLGSTSANLDTRGRSIFLSRFRTWTLASRFCRCRSGHFEICRGPSSTGNHVD